MAAKRLTFLRWVKNCANLEHFEFQMGGSPMFPHWLRAWGDRLGTPRAVDPYFSRSITIGKGRLLILYWYLRLCDCFPLARKRSKRIWQSFRWILFDCEMRAVYWSVSPGCFSRISKFIQRAIGAENPSLKFTDYANEEDQQISH